MRSLFIASFTFLSFLSIGQDLYHAIKNINSVIKANQFLEANPMLKAELIELNPDKDSSGLAKLIIGYKTNDPLVIDSLIYKKVNIKTTILLRVSYIFLNGNELPKHNLDSIREVILNRYRGGAPFNDLVKTYSMDGNPTGDLGWVEQEMLIKDFSKAVRKRKKGKIFMIDIPDKKWYYIVLKTFDERKLKKYTVLKVNTNFKPNK